ncbi:MAG TPA: VOC family protein [Chitinophagaceae bacterium]|nr:VOC family protein [Chitinophagaceae bacterium]
MTKDLWINLPVKDVAMSSKFYTGIGFEMNPKFGNGKDSACFIVSVKKIALMLFSHQQFNHFTGAAVADADKSAEMMISIDAESTAEVDELAKKAETAGGVVFGKPSEVQGWMYGCGFSDPDGHRWNVLYMDMSKMPKR